MAETFKVDSTELDQLAADLGTISELTGSYVRKAIEVTARNVRDNWREAATGMAHAPAYPFSITYDIDSVAIFGATVLRAEIGPDKERAQGALGNLLEFGSINNPPQMQGQQSLEANQADFEAGLNMALERAEMVAGVDASFLGNARAVIRGRY